MQKKNEFFTCVVCEETQRKGRSDAEALEEFKAMFPDGDVTKVEPVCDECFQRIMARRNAELMRN